MHGRAIKVKVVKETASKVTLHFLTLNRKMPVTKEEFKQRVENGLYEVVE